MIHYPIDPDGDVTLIIGVGDTHERVNSRAAGLEILVKGNGGPQSMLVDRRRMSAASRVWRAMFAPDRWHESNAEKIPLPDDHPKAMLTLLAICHVRFDLVPDAVGPSLLYQIAVMCDKYDCVHLTRPYIATWIRNWAQTYHLKPAVSFKDLFICWTFGLTKSLYNVMLDLAYELRNPKPNIYVTAHGKPFTDFGVPQKVIKTIFDMRNQALLEIDRACRKNIAKSEPSKLTDTYCTFKTNKKACDALVFGSMVAAVRLYIDLRPVEPPLIFEHSVRDIHDSIRSIKRPEQTFALPTNKDVTGHERCGEYLRDLTAFCTTIVYSTLSTMKSVKVWDVRMAKQAERCGTQAQAKGDLWTRRLITRGNTVGGEGNSSWANTPIVVESDSD